MRSLVIAIAVVAVLGVAGVALASSPSTGTDACYNTQTGDARVDVDGSGCRPKEAPFTIGGPLMTRFVDSEQVIVPAGDYRDAFAACPDGEVVLGGGFVTATIHPDVRPFQDQPLEMDGAQGWYVVVINESPVDIDFSAYAVCAPGTSVGFAD